MKETRDFAAEWAADRERWLRQVIKERDELISKLRADAQALADVRTLDDWARGEKGRSHDTGFAFDGLGYFCTLQERTVIKVQAFEAATPDEARAKAAAWVRVK